MNDVLFFKNIFKIKIRNLESMIYSRKRESISLRQTTNYTYMLEKNSKLKNYYITLENQAFMNTSV